MTTERLRRPLFVIAYIALLAAVSLEGGTYWLGKGGRAITDDAVADVVASYDGDAPSAADVRQDMQSAQRANPPAPGYGILHLALLDAVLLLVMTWMAASMVLPKATQGTQGRVQGIITLLLAIGFLIGAVTRAVVTFAKLVAMVSLIAATPFGFAAYMAIWGFFETRAATVILSMSMCLKVAFVVLLILAHRPFLKVKSMLLIIATSLVLTVATQFLIGMVPRPLASITDAVAGIINAIATAIWAIVLGVMSLISVRRALGGLASTEGS